MYNNSIMQTKTSQKILTYIKNHEQASGNELADFLALSDRAIRKQLSALLKTRTVSKIGKPPKVFYLIGQPSVIKEKIKISPNLAKKINKEYLIITPAGEKKEGVDGFTYWCGRNNLPHQKTAEEYVNTLAKYQAHKKDDLIDGLSKMKSTFDKVYLDSIYYLDFYSIERFGKTKLGQLLLYAKQSQNVNLMKEIVKNIKPSVNKLIKKYKIDGLGFIPPTVKREHQLMRSLEKGLGGNIKKISIIKIKTQVAVPQKTLSKLADRIENAKNTFVVDENTVFRNILLIDDAVGSGSTLNETAKKIREKNICKGKIVGLALTGSFKGFDVISEV